MRGLIIVLALALGGCAVLEPLFAPTGPSGEPVAESPVEAALEAAVSFTPAPIRPYLWMLLLLSKRLRRHASGMAKDLGSMDLKSALVLRPLKLAGLADSDDATLADVVRAKPPKPEPEATAEPPKVVGLARG